MTRKELDNTLLLYVERFSLGLANRMTYKEFEAMKDALLRLCVLCYTKGETTALTRTNERLRTHIKSLQV